MFDLIVILKVKHIPLNHFNAEDKDLNFDQRFVMDIKRTDDK